MSLIAFGLKLEQFIFTVYINMVTERMTLVNDALNTWNEDRNLKRKNIYYIGRTSFSIKFVSISFNLIEEMVNLIETMLTITVFQTLISNFCYIVFAIWTYIYYYRILKDSQFLLIMIVWSSYEFVSVILICYVCDNLLTKRNETKILANKIVMNYDLPKEARVQAKTLIEVVNACPLKIDIYGMFDVNITLILKFISVVTTCLIFLVQISHFV
nr:gustatory receptor 26 [Pieris rapae]